MAGNGRKWSKIIENGRKKDHRGYLVGNGFSRVSRHSPTTGDVLSDVKETIVSPYLNAVTYTELFKMIYEYRIHSILIFNISVDQLGE